MSTITIRIDEDLKRKMNTIKINWSEYIREAIRHKITLEEKKRAALKLLQDLKDKKYKVPKGFINNTIREMREAR